MPVQVEINTFYLSSRLSAARAGICQQHESRTPAQGRGDDGIYTKIKKPAFAGFPYIESVRLELNAEVGYSQLAVFSTVNIDIAVHQAG